MSLLEDSLEERIVVRVVPISAAQARALESVERAFFPQIRHGDLSAEEAREVAWGALR